MSDRRVTVRRSDKDGEWYWRETVSKVGGVKGEREIVADGSEGYANRQDAIDEARKATGLEPETEENE